MNNNKEITTKQRVIVVKDVFRVDNNEKIGKFNGYHAIAYAGAQLFYNVIEEQSQFTIGMLSEIANIEDSRTKNNIKKAIMELEEWKLITIKTINNKKINNNSMLMIEIPQIDTTNSKFTTINFMFVKNILQSDYSVQEKGNMLLMYMVLAQYMGNNKKAFPSIESLSIGSGLAVSTINIALQNLKDLNIIEYGNKGLYKTKDGTVQSSNNIYVFMDDKDANAIINHATKREKKPAKEDEISKLFM